MIITIILTVASVVGAINLVASIALVIVSRPFAHRGQRARHTVRSNQLTTNMPFVLAQGASHNQSAEV